MKQTNDWLASLFYNPNKDIDAFVNAGYNTENTILHTKDHYQNLKPIQEAFTAEDGTFKQEDFDLYYNSAVRTYNQFINDNLVNKAIEQSNDWSAFNIDKKGYGTLPTFGIVKVANPERRSMGISSLFGEGDAVRSMREAAQDNFVRDAQGNKLNYRPNDDDKRGLNFFKSRPLYYAKWEEDGIHLDAKNKEVLHQKGDYKLDETGNPYLQELGEDEDVSGKSLLMFSDTLTIDGSWANKYDILDSDGVDKSVAKQTLKLIATIAPIFVPVAGQVYGAGLIVANFADSMSSISKVGIEFFDKDYTNNKLWRMLNTTEAYTRSAVTEWTSSDKGNSGFFNFEAITNMIGNIGTQGLQQRLIATGTLKIMKAFGLDGSTINAQKKFIAQYGDEYRAKFGKSLKKALDDGDLSGEYNLLAGRHLVQANANKKVADKLARSASSWYMALTQSSEIVDSMKENNFESPYTAAATLAAMVGFKKIMDSELGDVALKGLGLDEVGKVVKEKVKTLATESKPAWDAIKTQAGKLAWIQRQSDKIVSKVQKAMNSSEFIESAMKESAEELSEEVLQDLIMQGTSSIAWSLKQLGLDQTNKGSWSYLDSNPLERYLAAAFGGALGGPINNAINIANNWKAYKQHKLELAKSGKTDTMEFIELVKKYGKDIVIKELEKQERKGNFPKTLSLEVLSGDNFIPVDASEKSQNSVMFDYLKRYVEYWDTLIHEEGLSISDSDLIDEALYKDGRVSALKKFGLGDEVITKFNGLLLQLSNANLKYKELYHSIKDEQKAGNKELAEVKATADNIRKQIQDLRKGVYADDFLDKTVFKLNRSLGTSLYSPDIYMYAKSINKDYSTANESDRKVIEDSYREFLENNEGVEDLAYEVFKRSRDLIQSEIKGVKEMDVKYLKDLTEQLNTLYTEEKLDGLDNPTEEDIIAAKKELRKDRSDDAIISELGLNPKQNTLSEEQKAQLVDAWMTGEIKRESDKKASKLLIANYQLGLDSRFFGDIQRLDKVVNIISDLKNKYGYIDSETAGKVKLIVDKLNVKDFSLKPVVDNFINSGSTLSYEFNDPEQLLSAIKPILDKVQSIDEEEKASIQEIGGNNITKVDFKRLNELEYEITLTTQFEEKLTAVITVESASNLLTDLLTIESPISTLTDFNNSDNDLIKQLRSVSEPSKSALVLIDKANKLLESDPVDLSSRLLSKISKTVYGEDITVLYKQLLKSLTSSNSIVDFIITDPSIESKLETIINSINLLSSILVYSTNYTGNSADADLFDFITVVNEFRKGHQLQELESISPEGANQIITQIQEVANAASLMQDISATNRGGKIKENKLVHTKAVGTWIKMFAVHKGLAGISLNGESFFDLDDLESNIIEIINKATNGQELLKDEVIALEKELLRVELYYHNKFQNLGEGDRLTLIQELAKLNPYGSIPSNLNKNFDLATLDNESVVTYVLSTFIQDPNDFRTNYGEAINNEDFKGIIPLYPQMLVVKEATATFFGYNYINAYLNEVIKLYPDISQNINLLNQIFIPGSAGSGKTKVVGKLIKQIINKQSPDTTFISYALKQDRANELHNTIKSSEVFSGYDIYSKWFPKDVVEEIKKFKESLSTSDIYTEELVTKKNEILAKIDRTKVSKTREIIIIDEYTHISNFELMLLGEIENVFLINLGDPKQNGFSGVLGNGGALTTITTPSLDISIRSNNNHKKDNLNKLSSIIDNIYRQNELYKIGKGGVSNTTSVLDVLKKTGFFQYAKEGPLPKGDYVSPTKLTAPEIESLIKDLKEGENIAYIYDKRNKPNSDISELITKYPGKFVTVHKDSVQGSEYSYTILDINYNLIEKSDSPETILNALRDLYTMMSRSKDGSIIVANNNILLSNSKLYNTYSSDTFDNSEIEDYKNFISEVYAGLGLQQITSSSPSKNDSPINSMGPNIQTSTTGVESLQIIADKDSKEFKELEQSPSFSVYQSHIMYNFDTGLNRNLGKWSRTPETIAKFNILKNLIFRSDEELTKILDDDNADRYQLSMLNKVYSLFTKYGYTSKSDIHQLIGDSDFYIQKVAYSKDYEAEDNKVNSNIEVPDYVYRIYRKLGDWEIDFGVITDPEKLKDDNIKKILVTANINQAFKLDKSKMNIKYAKAKITKAPEGTFTYENNSVDQFINNNPWANISQNVWVANKEVKHGSISTGYPFVLYSRDLFTNPDEFKSLLDKKISGENNDIVAMRISLHGSSFADYMKKWGSLYRVQQGSKVLKFKSFSGFRQPILMRRQLLRFQRFLEATIQGQNVEEAMRDLYSKNSTAINTDIAYYKSIIDSNNVTAYKKTLDALLLELQDSISHYSKEFKVDWERLDRNTFRKDTQLLLNSLPKANIINTLRTMSSETLSTKIKEIFKDKATEAMITGINSDIEDFLKLYDEFTKLANDNPNLLSTFQTAEGSSPNDFTNISSTLIDWLLNKGYAANFIGGTMLTHSLFRATSKNPDYMQIAALAIDNTAQYKDGIWANGIFSDMNENGFYKSSNTISDLYINSLIEIPNVYINLEAIQLEEKSNEEATNLLTEDSPEITLKSKLNKLNLQNYKGDQSELTAKIIENFNNRSDKNIGVLEFLNGKIIAINNTAVIISLNGDEVTAIGIDNTTSVNLLKSKAFNNPEDFTLIEDIKALIANNIPFQILVDNDKIQFNFTDQFFVMVNDKLERVDNIEVPTSSTSDVLDSLEHILISEGIINSISDDIDTSDSQIIKNAIESLKDNELIEAIDIKNTLVNYKNNSKKISKKALTNYMLQALNSNKPTNQC